MQALKHAIFEKLQNRPDGLFPFTVAREHLPSETWLIMATDVLRRGPDLAFQIGAILYY